MFALTESTPLYLCRQAVDMRKGIDGLYRLVRTELQQHPLSGSAFVFLEEPPECEDPALGRRRLSSLPQATGAWHVRGITSTSLTTS